MAEFKFGKLVNKYQATFFCLPRYFLLQYTARLKRPFPAV
ncbi:MAG: hypothetical protein CLLPBCKN_000226 [Chroococcidiopsis cubana SAG 39.79]|nr:hypothetical protein [Chroococcidiopsis cubana SAG 39.79]